MNIIFMFIKSGLVNISNDCYFNSALQSLAHNKLLLDYLINNSNDIASILLKNAPKILKENESFQLNKESCISEELKRKLVDENYSPNTLSDEEKKVILNSTIIYQFIRLIDGMNSKSCVILPTSFRKIFFDTKNNLFSRGQQHDAEEAYTCILQKMIEELSDSKNTEEINSTENIDEIARKEINNYFSKFSDNITKLHTGFIHSSITCSNSNCGYSSNKFDPFLHLQISIPSKNSDKINIQDCLGEYCKEEILDENNLWTCDKCHQKTNAVKELNLWLNPPVLVIQLKRFGIFDSVKNTKYVDYPIDNFDINFMISKKNQSNNTCTKYLLNCVVNHIGGLNLGHYYTYCLNNQNGKWYMFDDDVVSSLDENKVINNNAYLLFYIREDFI